MNFNGLWSTISPTEICSLHFSLHCYILALIYLFPRNVIISFVYELYASNSSSLLNTDTPETATHCRWEAKCKIRLRDREQMNRAAEIITVATSEKPKERWKGNICLLESSHINFHSIFICPCVRDRERYKVKCLWYSPLYWINSRKWNLRLMVNKWWHSS